MKTNVRNKFTEKTHEGAPAARMNSEQALRRSVMSCLLWEDEFYEDGQKIADRIASLVKEVAPARVLQIAIEARQKMHLRHVPLWIIRTMAKLPDHKGFVSYALAEAIQRPDELTEFLALYWKDKKQPLSKQVKLGLAEAFKKFDAYQLAKYNRDGAVKLRDVLFLCHAKPKDPEQEAIWKKLIDGTLETPDTWEVALSSGEYTKTETWERLLREKKLGGFALIRNLRNMKEAKVDEGLVTAALDEMKTDRILPFRFIAAARYAPQWESNLEGAMFRSLEGRDKLPGKTILLIDVSGSMEQDLSSRSEMKREDAASGLAILARELCDNVEIFTFSNKLVRVPARHGFALRDAIHASQDHGGTRLGSALEGINSLEPAYDRLVVITDEQSHDSVPNSRAEGFMINVASNRNGVGYGAWNHIDGWSDAIFDYLIAANGGDLEEDPEDIPF